MIRNHFSVENKTARHMRRKGYFVSERFYSITPAGRFDLGLFLSIYKYMKEILGLDDIRVDSEVLQKVNPIQTKTQIEYLSFAPRDYQSEMCERAFKFGRGVFEVATGGGKTYVMAVICHNLLKNNLAKRILVLEPDLGLVEQIYDEFLKYGIQNCLEKYTGENDFNSECEIVVANIGVLNARGEERIEGRDAIIIDEAHKYKRGNKINKILDKLNASIRFGFTGTLPDEKEDVLCIEGKIGPVIYKKTSVDLKEYLTQAICNVIELNYKFQPEWFSPDDLKRYRQEYEFVINHSNRNKIISKISCNLQNNTLVLIDRIQHGLELQKILEHECELKKVFFIRGELEVDVRNEIRQLMEQKNNVVCIAISSIFATGIDIKNLHNIILANAGKAKIRLLQSIGRGLRLHPNKHKLMLIDLADQLYYGKKHFEKRLEIYNREQIETKINQYQII
jgi:superfamily II DNA or RNA helicase